MYTFCRGTTTSRGFKTDVFVREQRFGGIWISSFFSLSPSLSDSLCRDDGHACSLLLLLPLQRNLLLVLVVYLIYLTPRTRKRWTDKILVLSTTTEGKRVAAWWLVSSGVQHALLHERRDPCSSTQRYHGGFGKNRRF